MRECMVGAVAIRLKDPVFESQTKNKLGNTEIRTDLVNSVREELLHFFNRNKEIAEKIIAKVEDTQQLRKELQEVKKLARERAKAITIRIPQLKDCKNHFDKAKGKGQGHDGLHHAKASPPPARSSSCRDVNTQADLRAQGQAAQRLGPQARHRLQERRDVQSDAQRSTSRTTSKACATTRSFSPPTPTWTACTSAI